MLLLHVDLERLLVLVVPVTLGALQGLAGVVGGVPAEAPESVADHHVVLQGLGGEDPGAAWSRVERAGRGRVILGHPGRCRTATIGDRGDLGAGRQVIPHADVTALGRRLGGGSHLRNLFRAHRDLSLHHGLKERNKRSFIFAYLLDESRNVF